MKMIMLFLCVGFFFAATNAQDITGSWNGSLEIQGSKYTLVVHITHKDDRYKGTIDIPDQGVKDFNIREINFVDSVLTFSIPEFGSLYTGKINKENNLIDGTFTQRTLKTSLVLHKGDIQTALNRPQEPKPPFPYYTEDVKIENTKDSVTLAGTLTLPDTKKKYPVVILITGSGPQDRDENVLGHKPFLVIADHLTRNGIGVLRYDDRGIAKSTGDFRKATTEDFANDVLACIKYLKTRKEIDPNQIGLIGHSEGGLTAPLVANKSKDVKFIVLLAGSGIPFDELMALQRYLMGKAEGMDSTVLKMNYDFMMKGFSVLKKGNDISATRANYIQFLKEMLKSTPDSLKPDGSEDSFISSLVNGWANPWFINLIKYDPFKILVKVKCPVLSLNGEKDLQVPYQVNQSKIKEALQKGKNKDYLVKSLPGLNHLFQKAETGLPWEYGKIEETFSPVALAEISTWIQKHIKR